MDLQTILERIKQGEKTILIAEYGVGKSMLLRHLFFLLVQGFRSKNHFRTPVAINLRDHLGQTDPVELLERHARQNAVDPQKLVAAWNAGYVDLLIDGFDELSTRGWTGDIRRLREYRRSSHAVIRKLFKDSPKATGILITGRDVYFDSHAEMRDALAAPERIFDICRVHPFDEMQVGKFLNNKGLSGEIPEWIPTRPLLLTYLVTKGLLKAAMSADFKGDYPRGVAWLSLIDLIADRESGQTDGVDKASLLEFFGALALISRQAPDGRLSFSPKRMEEIFSNITGATIMEDERNILLRLPGLGVAQDDSLNRSFIDTDLQNVCCALPILQFIEHPYGGYHVARTFETLSTPLSEVGVEAVYTLCEQSGVACGQMKAALLQALNTECTHLAFDIFSTLIRRCNLDESFAFEGIEIDEVDLSLEHFDGVRASFVSCLIDKLVLPQPTETNQEIVFRNCLIGSVEGRVSEADLATQQFLGSEVSSFTDEYSVNSQVLGTSLALGVRVLVVTLRKLFRQYGSSRLESALVRGLDQRSRLLVPDVIRLLLKHQFILPTGRKGRVTYSGTKAKRAQALKIIQSPNIATVPIVGECAALGER